MEAKRAMMVEQTREQSLLDNFATTAPRDQFIFNADIDSSLAYGIESASVYASTDNQNSWVSAPATALNTEGYENTWEGEVFTGDGNSVYSYLAGEVNSEVLGEEFGTILVSSSPHNVNGSWPVSDNLYARLATDTTGDAPQVKILWKFLELTRVILHLMLMVKNIQMLNVFILVWI